MDRNSTPYHHVLEDQMAAEQAYHNLLDLVRTHPTVQNTGEFNATHLWYLAASRALALAVKLQSIDLATAGVSQTTDPEGFHQSQPSLAAMPAAARRAGARVEGSGCGNPPAGHLTSRGPNTN